MRTYKSLEGKIGRAIARARQAAGLTQAQVAEKLGISNDAVSRMERGAIMPTVARLIELSEIFHCEAAELLTGSSPLLRDQLRYMDRLLADFDEEERGRLLDTFEKIIDLYRFGRR